ncbi:hypothetical protein MYAM1_001050 [Malassezia yamatoensis]|uniref:BZIP domain-containing protein n=1 Tax=Malassezia yamatoensis TaxID=253288 RepID=A0AAJ6CG10_9BASI|nr:hypothetical protein MYAM1_001050 [Malassezia yamatoensis]
MNHYLLKLQQIMPTELFTPEGQESSCIRATNATSLGFPLEAYPSFAPLSLGLKTEDNELSTSLSLSPLNDINCHDITESIWSDESPGMSDSLTSLDFESTEEPVASSVLRSPSFSETSPTVSAVVQFSDVGLFTPLNNDSYGLKRCQEEEPYSRSTKRVCTEPSKMSMSFPNLETDFTLFPEEDEVDANKKPVASLSSLELHSGTNGVYDLLSTLNNRKISESPPAAEPVMTASLPEIASGPSVGTLSSTRGTRRRRRDVDELLPIDAPIQSRTYVTESVTSRRDSSESCKNESPATDSCESPVSCKVAQDNTELDSRSMKRLSNTLAARRSRHRKAEELKNLNNTIEQLKAEVAQWKSRCQEAERQRDQYWSKMSSMAS